MGIFKKVSKDEMNNEVVWSQPVEQHYDVQKALNKKMEFARKTQEMLNEKFDGNGKRKYDVKELAEACYNVAFGSFNPDDVVEGQYNKCPGIYVRDRGLSFLGKTNGLSNYGVLVTENGDVYLSHTSDKPSGIGFNGYNLAFISNGDGTVSFDESKSWREGPFTYDFKSMVNKVEGYMNRENNKIGMFNDFINEQNATKNGKFGKYVDVQDFVTNKAYSADLLKQAIYNVMCEMNNSAPDTLGGSSGYAWQGMSDIDRKYYLVDTDTGFSLQGIQKRELEPTSFEIDFDYASDDVNRKGGVKCVSKTSTGKFKDVNYTDRIMKAVDKEYVDVLHKHTDDLWNETDKSREVVLNNDGLEF